MFDIQILQELEIEDQYQEIFSPLELSPLVTLFQKENTVGAPITVNYEASIRALMIHFLEGIPTIKALVTRIKQDIRFKLSLGFLYGDRNPSEATFSRILQTLSENIDTLEHQNALLLKMIDQEFRIFEEPVAIDATAVEAHTKPLKKETFGKTVVSETQKQQNMTTQEIKQSLPTAPQWGIKANSQNKHNHWFGYKAHLAATSNTQYILSAILTSGNIADVSVAIPLMRETSDLGVTQTHVLLDKGYDA